MPAVLQFVLRGAIGFGLGGLIAMGLVITQSRSVPDNLHYLPRAEGESPLTGQWQDGQSPIRSAQFEADGTFLLLGKARGSVSEGTYTMLDDASAQLKTNAPWVTATVRLNPAYPGSPELDLGNEDGTITTLRWFRKSAPADPPPGGTLWMFGVPFLCAGIGAGVLTWGKPHAVRAIIGFGLGAIPAAFVVLFTLISLQGGGRPDYLWGALGCGIGFALAGGIGGLSIRPALLLPGLFCFGLAGAAWGPLAFWCVTHGSGAGSPGGVAAALGLILIPFSIGGGLFGAAMALFDPDE